MTGQDYQPWYYLDDGILIKRERISPRNEEHVESSRQRNERFYQAFISWAKERVPDFTSDRYGFSMREAEARINSIRAVWQYPVLHLDLDREKQARILTKHWPRPLVKETEIRLFRMTGSITIDECSYLKCEFVHADLDEAPSYHAVSYAWGSLNVNYPIIINDNECLLITRSLQDFLLQAFLFPEKTRNALFWADQLCIDQYNTDERSQQVLLMHRIFQQSQLTHLWLGKEDESTQWLDILLAAIGASSLKYQTARKAVSRPSIQKAISILASDPAIGVIPSGSFPGWEAVERITNRPWFSRMWVFQEAVAAPTSFFVCGKYVFHFNTLELALLLLPTMWSNVVSLDLEKYAKICSMRLYHSISHGPKDEYGDVRQDLLELLSNTRTFECSDTRDRVYAALSLQSNEDQVRIPIDYNKTVS